MKKTLLKLLFGMQQLRQTKTTYSATIIFKQPINKMFTNHMHAAATLEELLSYDDENFVQCAYYTLLERAPDQEGMRYYLKRLRSNVSKIEILAQLRASKEAKPLNIKIPGLNDIIRRHKHLKTPLLGPLLRIAGAKPLGKIEQAHLKISRDAGQPKLVDLLQKNGLHEGILPEALTLEIFNRLNPHDHFDTITDAILALVTQPTIRKLRVCDNDDLNANLYVLIALHHESEGRNTMAIEIYRLSLLFANTATAHEHLGNLSLGANRHHQAVEHYKMALDLKSRSHWVYANLSQALALCGDHQGSVQALCRGLSFYPGSDLLMSKVDEKIHNYWYIEEQKLDCLASAQDREKLIREYERVTSFISESYAKIFRRNSEMGVITKLNSKRVLIIGLTQDGAPQCFRYRIDQKIEQLRYAGYTAETVAWHEQELGLKKINFYDLIIFYRVPAFPGVLKLVEYARSLGKITFFEVDDLLFETKSVPALETYGGQISLGSYTNVTKDIGSYRSMALRCDYAIASTLPLVRKLAPLVQTGTGFLHRNGLDKHNRLVPRIASDKGYINLFYGSGTLAHNSDFIIEALPAISKILRECKHVKLTIVGYLTLPTVFCREFGTRVIQVPLVKNIAAYWEYLSASDINLAVLHDDELTGCKSELKWFEAAAFSIPSVVSRTQNYLDVIRNGEDGFVVFGENEWYLVLRKLIENRELRSQIGTNAFLRVKTEYSIKSLAKNMDKIVKEAIAHRYASGMRNTKELSRTIND